MGHVDYMSRNPEIRSITLGNISKNQSDFKTLKEFQNEDSFCQQLHKKLEDGYTVKNSLIYYSVTKATVTDDGFRCFVPAAARLKVMRTYHDEAAHVGWEKSIKRLRQELYWPRMGQTLKKYIRNCRACTQNKSHTGKKSGLYQLGEKATKPFEVWHIDHAGPLVASDRCTQILVVIDAYSKYCKFCPIRNKKIEYTIIALGKVFQKLGKPQKIIADRAFVSAKFKTFLYENNVDLHLIATGMPRGNGQVERMMRTLFNLMRSVLNDKKESSWTSVIPQIEAVLNETANDGTGVTPNLLMFGKRERLPAEHHLLKGIAEPANDSLNEVREKAAARMKKKQKSARGQIQLEKISGTTLSSRRYSGGSRYSGLWRQAKT